MGVRRLGGFEGCGPKGGATMGGGGPKFRAFFISPAAKFVLFFPLWGSSVEFWWCLKRRDAQMCAVGVLWLFCEAPAAHLSVPALQTPPKFNEKTPPEREERKKFPAGERKKERNFGRSRRRAVRRRGVRGRAVRRGRVRGRGPKILNTPTAHTGRKKSEILGGPERAVRRRGVRRKVGRTHKTQHTKHNNTQQQQQQQQQQQKIWPKHYEH